jgi:hypothetical protein
LWQIDSGIVAAAFHLQSICLLFFFPLMQFVILVAIIGLDSRVGFFGGGAVKLSSMLSFRLPEV